MELYDYLNGLTIDTSDCNLMHLSRTINKIENNKIFDVIFKLMIHHYLVETRSHNIYSISHSRYHLFYKGISHGPKGPIFDLNNLPPALIQILYKYIKIICR